MMIDKSGPIVVIEDDLEDQAFIEQAFCDIQCDNIRVYFEDGLSAIDYLKTSDVLPFLIISDMNLPIMDGLELKRKLRGDTQTHMLSIPYVYFTTGITHNIVLGAYNALAQGYFVKPGNYRELVETIRVIVQYWTRCISPNSFISQSATSR
jgi:CheY-like chemotaxis protein